MMPRKTPSRMGMALALAGTLFFACHRSLSPPTQEQPEAVAGAEQAGADASEARTGGPVGLADAIRQAEVADSKKVSSIVEIPAVAQPAGEAAAVPELPASVAPAAAAPSTCVSATCHAKVLAGDVVHPVAEGCDSCHEFNGTEHPTKGAKSFKLVQEPPDLCYTCHDTFGGKKTVHPPVADGLCTVCHDAHSTNHPKLLAETVGDTCTTCHPDHTGYKVTHGPVSAGDCTACHTPHESDTAKLLVKTGEQLCFGCHVDMQDVLSKSDVHPALEGGCTSCHNPHGGKFARMLDEQGPGLCFGCHPDIQEAVNESTVSHPALDTDAGCAACHSPHSSDNTKLLLKPQKDICLECHDDVIPKNLKYQHGPGNDGQCARCHSPHGSKNEHLLVGEFPADAYVPYTDREYALCFKCHNRDLLQYPETSFATGFRNGDKNLHYVHVHNEKKGRSCRLCHSWHGSNNPKLIADTVSFGKWNLPLRFVKTETGGGCSPGCHKPQHYDRESPGRKPPPTPKGGGNADAKKGA